MPTYAYKCPACGHSFEEFKDMCSSEEDKQTCPECGKPACRQIGTGEAVIFYGPGFHCVDRRTIKDARISKKKKPDIVFPVTDRRKKK